MLYEVITRAMRPIFSRRVMTSIRNRTVAAKYRITSYNVCYTKLLRKINENSHNIKSNEILDIESDEDGYVWIGTKAGLSAYLSGTVFDFREEYQPVGFQINDIFIDSQGRNNFV